MRSFNRNLLILFGLVPLMVLAGCFRFKSKIDPSVAQGGFFICGVSLKLSEDKKCEFSGVEAQTDSLSSGVASVKVLWSKPAGFKSGSILYDVFTFDSSTLTTYEDLKSKAKKVASDLPTTTAVISSISTAKASYFYIVAKGGNGSIIISSPALYDATSSGPTPGGGGSLSVPSTAIGYTSITLNWSEATAADGSNNVSYDVYQSTSNNLGTLASTLANGTRLTSPSLAAGTIQYTVTGLLPSRSYSFNIVVTDNTTGKQSIYSSTSASTLTDSLPPTVGGGGSLSFSAVGAAGFTVSFTAASDVVDASSQLEYLLYYSTSNNIATLANIDANNGTAFGTWTANVTSFNVTGLGVSTTYYVNVVARDTSGNRVIYTSNSQATTADTTSPTAGTSISYTTVGDTSITLSWGKATDNVTSQAALQYRVFYSTSDNITNVANAESNGTAANAWTADISTLPVTGLSVSTTYYFQVLVQDAAGNKTAYAASTSQATTADTTSPVPGSSGAITFASVGAAGLTVNWTAATDNVTAQASLQYRIYYSTSNNIATAATAVSNGTAANGWTANIATLLVTGLSPSTTYYFQVLVRDAATNTAAYTSNNQATTADTTAPTPGNSGTITATSVASTSLTLNWTAATDNVTSASSLEYLAYQSTSNNIGSVANAEANGTAIGSYTANIATVNVTSLTASTTYYFQVIVRDGAGNKAAYTSMSQATSAGGGGSSSTERYIFVAEGYSSMGGALGAGSGSSVKTYGADTTCSTAAAAGSVSQNINNSNPQWSWNAFIGAAGYAAKNRFFLPTSVTVKNTYSTPQTVATSAAQLYGSSNLTNAVIANQSGGTYVGSTIWTGGISNWAAETDQSCANWSTSSAASSGRIGVPGSTLASEWMENQSGSALLTCDTSMPVYCINTPPAFIFISSVATYTGNFGGVTGADTICENLAAAGTLTQSLGVVKWRALLSGPGAQTAMSARDRLSLPHNTKVYLPNFTTLVANTTTQLFNDSGATLSSVVNMDENGNAVGGTTVWVGSMGMQNCSNWSTASSGSSGMTGTNSASNSNWLVYNTPTCDTTQRIYCIGQ